MRRACFAWTGPAHRGPRPQRRRPAKGRPFGRRFSDRGEWRGGIAPPRSRRTVRDTLASYGSHCSAAYGFARSTGFLPSLVDPGFGLNNAVPSVQLHYRAFIPTTDRPAPVPCIGTLILAGTACLDFSLNIRATGSRVPHRSLDQSHAAFMPDAAWAEIRPSPRLVPGYRIPPGFDIILHFSTPHQRFACARLSKPYLTGQAPPFPQRSPPRLFTVATCGGLKPTPDGRLRGACPHLLCSSAPPLLLVLSRHTLVQMPHRVRLQATLSQVGRDHRSEMIHPTPNCLVGHRHSAFRQQIFDVAQAEGEPEVEPYRSEPYRLVNDLGREPVSGIADFCHPLG